MHEWEELEEYAKSLGWKVNHNKGDAHNFEKPDKRIWYCGRANPILKFWWQARNRNGDRLAPYETRREYDTLKEALDNE